LLQRFLDQDIEMMESEQQTYSANPKRRYVEVNPAIIALQRLIVRQYEQFMQQSSQSQSQCQQDSTRAMSTSPATVPNSAEQISQH
jgi:renierapurpurin 18,18'-hydroxylase